MTACPDCGSSSCTGHPCDDALMPLPLSMDELPLIDPACQREFARKLRRLIGL